MPNTQQVFLCFELFGLYMHTLVKDVWKESSRDLTSNTEHIQEAFLSLSKGFNL